ncbi:DUF3604 domain-containing protein [Falsihalocynthiibacter sp. S25ZX9]|uniref:DUF3604 domain-containing protein n=1 Tax=Falsihalocynthiibacter sp. S25ZX9 TaxID=3240870 RepID=UPI00350FE739
MFTLHRIVIFRDGPERAGQVEPCTTTPPMGAIDPRKLCGWLQNYEDKTDDMLAGEYPQSGLQRGLMLKETLGVNPFNFGMVGAGDNHISMSSPGNDSFIEKKHAQCALRTWGRQRSG